MNQYSRCPNCGAKGTMQRASCQRTKFSVKKAVVGSLIAGPLGTVTGGFIGDKKYSYRCNECGFIQKADTLVQFKKYKVYFR